MAKKQIAPQNELRGGLRNLGDRRAVQRDELALGELEALTGTWATGLLTFFRTGIASEQACLLQHRAEFCINSDECASHTETDSTHLASDATTVGVHSDIIGLMGVGELEGKQNLVLQRQRWEVFLKAATVNGDLAIAIAEKHTCDCGFAASCGA